MRGYLAARPLVQVVVRSASRSPPGCAGPTRPRPGGRRSVAPCAPGRSATGTTPTRGRGRAPTPPGSRAARGESLPQAGLRVPERRNATLRGHSGAAEHHDLPCSAGRFENCRVDRGDSHTADCPRPRRLVRTRLCRVATIGLNRRMATSAWKPMTGELLPHPGTGEMFPSPVAARPPVARRSGGRADTRGPFGGGCGRVGSRREEPPRHRRSDQRVPRVPATGEWRERAAEPSARRSRTSRTGAGRSPVSAATSRSC